MLKCILRLLVVMLDKLEHIKGSVPGLGSKPLLGDCGAAELHERRISSRDLGDACAATYQTDR